jgi:uncharacterized protein
VLLVDVNILVYAFRADVAEHSAYRRWLDDTIDRPDPFAVTTTILSGFLRIVTNQRVFPTPAPLSEAITFVRALTSQPNCMLLYSSARHLELFLDLCSRSDAKAKLIPDAEIAALAIEQGCTLVSADRDFARFPGLSWRHPLDESG